MHTSSPPAYLDLFCAGANVLHFHLVFVSKTFFSSIYLIDWRLNERIAWNSFTFRRCRAHSKSQNGKNRNKKPIAKWCIGNWDQKLRNRADFEYFCCANFSFNWLFSWHFLSFISFYHPVQRKNGISGLNIVGAERSREASYCRFELGTVSWSGAWPCGHKHIVMVREVEKCVQEFFDIFWCCTITQRKRAGVMSQH